MRLWLAIPAILLMGAGLPAKKYVPPGGTPAAKSGPKFITPEDVNALIDGVADAEGRLSDVEGRVSELGENVRKHGAVGDGAADDAPRLVAANAAAPSGEVVLPAGTYRVASSVTFTARVRMLRGALLSIDAGKTVTFNGGFDAGLHQVFSGSGAVAFSRAKTREGFPEWWGFVTDLDLDGVLAGNLAALNAAEAALPVVVLQDADYWVGSTWNIDTSHVTIRGTSKHSDGVSNGTRIVLKSGSGDVLFLGTVGLPPGGPNYFTKEIALENLHVTRDGVLTPPGVGSEASGAAGVRVKHTLYAYIRHVSSAEHTLGFAFEGTVQTHVEQSFAFRSQPASSPVNDIFWGFYQNGTVSIGMAGGNASTYYTDCAVTIGWTPLTSPLAQSIGFNLAAGPVDTFMLRPETASVDYGLWMSGGAEQDDNVDVHVTDGVFDQFGVRGIYVTGLDVGATVSISNAFAAPYSAAPSAVSCFEVASSAGAVSLANSQCVAFPAPATIGLRIASSSGVQARGNMYISSRRPIALDGATHCVVEDLVNTPAGGATQAAVWTRASSRNRLAVTVKGGAGAFPQGVHLSETANAFNEVNMSGVDPAAVTGGAANKLQIGGVSITATGCYTGAGVAGACDATNNNLVSGVMW